MTSTENETRTGGVATGEGTDEVVRGAEGMPETSTTAELAAKEDVEEAMRDVVDPELGINVVDLGLVYGVQVEQDNSATIEMTLTSPACPLTDVIEEQARSALTGGPGGGLVKDFQISWVWIPPWGPEKITEEGREQLRALGFTL
ncbi:MULTISPECIES: metal-sulfur cluster assembly factor [unclassified Actinopolyspora]|uniref:iron-sulfur cluster assembly protein n=1 Tax=unclassified Actinopolyspora TaxID=2639451 RepID=UPI0013F5A91F|nr:metal-sulfur cluster assembly factor [Actinopolyspora sp. BKK2]NHE76625.1 metal-sulfur cluster assembly factor [Actinopolyspora sp. BKK1]